VIARLLHRNRARSSCRHGRGAGRDDRGAVLPIGLFPQVSFPRVVVDLDAGSRPADQTALTVTRPVEEAIRALPGVRDVRSETSRGSAQISIDFRLGPRHGRQHAAGRHRDRPRPARAACRHAYNVRRMDPTVFPIISYALVARNGDPVACRIWRAIRSPRCSPRSKVSRGSMCRAADQPRSRFWPIPGASPITAGDARSGQGDPRRQCAERGRAGAGSGRLSLVIADRSVVTARQVGDIVVKSDATGVVRVRDVATVQDGRMPQWMRIVEDGKPAVLFNIYEQPDGNAVQIAQEVQPETGDLAPPGVRLVNWYDQSELVTQSVASVRDAVLIGLVLAALVLLFFLRSWRVTLVAVIVVPATLAATVLVLSMLGMSFNIMTLGGIAAAVGLLIDDVIVMVEHIARRAGARDEQGRVATQRRVRRRARIHGTADRIEPGDADRLPAALLPDRRDRAPFPRRCR
jgi:multidrug efflux pump subunit AcrB